MGVAESKGTLALARHVTIMLGSIGNTALPLFGGGGQEFCLICGCSLLAAGAALAPEAWWRWRWWR